MQLLKNTNFDFVGQWKIASAVVISTLVLLIISNVFHDGMKLGIDFKGGTLMQFHFEKPVSISEVRSSVGAVGYGDSEIKHFGEDNEVLIWMHLIPNPEEVATSLGEVLGKTFPENKYEVVRVEAVGPKIGSELINGAVWAVILASLLIIVYLSWRFEFRFAMTALVCALFDVVFIVMFFSVLSIELSLATVAAILTILGYSLNDTIVILDRIRENMKSLKKENFPALVNRSLNETLSRSIITSLTTFLVVLILFLFGGEVIHDFTTALLIGVVEGSYSTLFVAAPFLVGWHNRTERKKHAKLKGQ